MLEVRVSVVRNGQDDDTPTTVAAQGVPRTQGVPQSAFCAQLGNSYYCWRLKYQAKRQRENCRCTIVRTIKPITQQGVFSQVLHARLRPPRRFHQPTAAKAADAGTHTYVNVKQPGR